MLGCVSSTTSSRGTRAGSRCARVPTTTTSTSSARTSATTSSQVRASDVHSYPREVQKLVHRRDQSGTDSPAGTYKIALIHE